MPSFAKVVLFHANFDKIRFLIPFKILPALQSQIERCLSIPLTLVILKLLSHIPKI